MAYYILKDSDAAEDVCQDVFLKLWDKRAEWHQIESMEGYLVQMARNRALNIIESTKREEELVIALETDTISLSLQDIDYQDNTIHEKIALAVSQLAPQTRLIFSLSRFEGLTNDEIATHLGISKRTVETQISSALKRFRTDLRPIFFSNLALFLLTNFL